jgi:hypothetical protein
MSQFSFYAAILRFVAAKTERVDERVAGMMDELTAAAGQIEAGGRFQVAGDRLELTARAFAGVAGLLQKSILPEAVAHGNAAGETQIRWAVDAAMEAVSLLLSRAALQKGEPVEVVLPEPPVV